jgi:hypothetical protein
MNDVIIMKERSALENVATDCSTVSQERSLVNIHSRYDTDCGVIWEIFLRLSVVLFRHPYVLLWLHIVV